MQPIDRKRNSTDAGAEKLAAAAQFCVLGGSGIE